MIDGSSELLSRAQITDVILRWCRAVDRKDFDSIRDLFHPDAVDDHHFYRGDINGLIEVLRDRHRSLGMSFHSVSNTLIEFVHAAAAVVETYVTVAQRWVLSPGCTVEEDQGGGAKFNQVFCRYIDRFERRDLVWRIAERHLVIDGVVEFHGAPPAGRLPKPGSDNRGRRDGQDLLHKLRRHYLPVGSVPFRC